MTSREGSMPAAGLRGYTELDKKEDVKVLHSMGYAQELERRLSRFSNFAVSFSIICILSGGINSLAQGTSGAGGIAIGVGLAARMLCQSRLRRCDGADQLGLSDGGWALSLGLDSRQPRHRMGDGLAQSARPDHRARRHQCRHLDLLRRRIRSHARHREHPHQSNDLPDHHHRRPGAHQSSRHPADGRAYGLFRLADLRRRRPDRGRLPDRG